ncbi:MAG: efflux RND transporter periplasmic adaptor subunit [Acidobacteriota bacterium]|nr:efflux RND transporter periplasmic adaptor subunit [Acidobacteriota bacterium]
MRRRILVGVMAVAVLGGAAAVAMRSGNSGVEVEQAQVARVDALQSFVTASGEIVATKYADIGSAVMGRLVELMVKEGDAVKTGQVLARIDPVQAASSADAAAASVGALEADARAAATQVKAAQAALEESRSREKEAAASLTRAQELQRAGLLPQSEFDKANMAGTTAAAQVAAATASLERAQQAQASAERRITQGRAESTRARDALSKTEITAPIDGVVTRLEVEQGEMVVMGVQNQPGTILMTVSDLSAVNAEVKVAEADVMRLSNGFPATVTLEALPLQKFSGRVVEIGASALPLVGTQAAAREFRVKVRLDGATASLRPGLTCDTEILVAERKNALVVPLQAVVEKDGKSGVFVVRDGTVVFTPVTTGIIGGLSIEVDGVAEGTEIVSGPFQILRALNDGDRVHVMSR